MKSKFIPLIALILFLSTGLYSQSKNSNSQEVLTGVSELRKDIINRQQKYFLAVRTILEEIDVSDLDESIKQILIQYIRRDFAQGGISNSTEAYEELPNDSPFKSPYIAKYVRRNEDYSIDRSLIKELKSEGILKGDALKLADITPLITEIQFMDIKPNDQILHVHAGGAMIDLILGYTFEKIELTVHNKYTDLHFTAMDRMDRFPSVNNGNVIEFLNINKDGVYLDGEQWDKIIIRDPLIYDNELQGVLKPIHDNLTDDGHVYLKVKIKSSDKCPTGRKKEKLLKNFTKQDYEVLASHDFDCQTIFKLKSIKENN